MWQLISKCTTGASGNFFFQIIGFWARGTLCLGVSLTHHLPTVHSTVFRDPLRSTSAFRVGLTKSVYTVKHLTINILSVIDLESQKSFDTSTKPFFGTELTRTHRILSFFKHLFNIWNENQLMSQFYSYIAGSLHVSGPQAHLQESSYSCSHNHWFSI